jgi:hypothetical protein
MFIAHILHGCLLLLVFVFALPLVFLLAGNVMSNHRAPLTQSLRLFFHTLQGIYKAIAASGEALAETIAQRFPSQQSWMKIVLKPLITASLVFGALYLISDCGY